MIGSLLRRTAVPLLRTTKVPTHLASRYTRSLTRGFFGFGGKKKQQEKTTAPEDVDVKDSDNLSFLIEDVRKVNQLRASRVSQLTQILCYLSWQGRTQASSLSVWKWMM